MAIMNVFCLNRFFIQLYWLRDCLRHATKEHSQGKLFHSAMVLWENSNNWHLHVSLLAVIFLYILEEIRLESRTEINIWESFTHVILDENCEVEYWKSNEINQMTDPAAHIPWWVSGVGLWVEIVCPTMEPMEVAVHMELLEVSEFEHWMVLQVVVL